MNMTAECNIRNQCNANHYHANSKKWIFSPLIKQRCKNKENAKNQHRIIEYGQQYPDAVMFFTQHRRQFYLVKNKRNSDEEG